MHVSIDVTGTKAEVKEAVASQIRGARKQYEHSGAALAALGDEIGRRVTSAPGSLMSVSAHMAISIDVIAAEDEGMIQPTEPTLEDAVRAGLISPEAANSLRQQVNPSAMVVTDDAVAALTAKSSMPADREVPVPTPGTVSRRSRAVG